LNDDDAFKDWKLRASECDILSAAVCFGAKLRKAGSEHYGPCKVCGGRDRFAVNTAKRIFICRGGAPGGGDAGGDVIGMTMHLKGLDFLGACELLTKEPPPRGKSRTTAEAQAEIEKRRAQAERDREQRDKTEQAQREEKAQTAAAIWDASVPIAGTLGETYLLRRNLIVPPGGWPPCVRFHYRLPYDFDKSKSFGCLVARVDDVAGDLTAIWREFIAPDGSKAPVEKQKLGLGSAMGGAIRIGGVGRKIGAAEGFRTAIGAWLLVGCRYPVWSLMATAGFSNVELPLGVEEVRIFPDGDRPFRKKDGGFVPVDVPPGLVAARILRDRAKAMGVKSSIEPVPLAGFDYENVWQSTRG
jgi:hypothetical protein